MCDAIVLSSAACVAETRQLQKVPEKTGGVRPVAYATVNLRTNWPLFHCASVLATPVTMQIANVLDRLAVTLLSHSCHNECARRPFNLPGDGFEVRLNAS